MNSDKVKYSYKGTGMKQVESQGWGNRSGRVSAAVRFGVVLCLLAAVILSGLSTHSLHAGTDVTEMQAASAQDVGGATDIPSALPGGDDCALHPACQGLIAVAPLPLTAPVRSLPRPPARLSARASSGPPPLPQPPNFS